MLKKIFLFFKKLWIFRWIKFKLLKYIKIKNIFVYILNSPTYVKFRHNSKLVKYLEIIYVFLQKIFNFFKNTLFKKFSIMYKNINNRRKLYWLENKRFKAMWTLLFVSFLIVLMCLWYKYTFYSLPPRRLDLYDHWFFNYFLSLENPRYLKYLEKQEYYKNLEIKTKVEVEYLDIFKYFWTDF